MLLRQLFQVLFHVRQSHPNRSTPIALRIQATKIKDHVFFSYVRPPIASRTTSGSEPLSNSSISDTVDSTYPQQQRQTCPSCDNITSISFSHFGHGFH